MQKELAKCQYIEGVHHWTDHDQPWHDEDLRPRDGGQHTSTVPHKAPVSCL